jgi:Na+/H+ antiporter NhaD/arsenite permease-like protein
MHQILLSISHNITPPVWLVIPFASLLLAIAIGPIFFEKIWHHYYKHFAVAIGLLVGVYYIFEYELESLVLETFAEYVSFISLLASLFVCAGGIYVFVDRESKAVNNIAFLLIGALLTNLIGTTGASILLIRPYMRMNRYRLKVYHVVFFIFFISNLGGLLTPIGDPPLFMGFLKGVPFFWTLTHLWSIWIVAMILLSIAFYYFEKRNNLLDEVDTSAHFTNRIIITGGKNFIWLGVIIVSVFLDPNIIEGFPYIEIHGKKVSFIREIIQLSVAFLAYRYANKKALTINKFNFEPIFEVGFLFFGIFMSMIPALQLLESLGKESNGLSVHLIYWSTGIFSSVLDNAPTYINFLALSLTTQNLSLSSISDVVQFATSENAIILVAISTASVFFGALTYIGNGPNFMVKAIAEQTGIKMPGFFQYMYKYSLIILLPILFIIWVLFFLI